MARATRAAPTQCEYLWNPTTRCPNAPLGGGDFCQQHCPPAQVEVYKAVAEHFRLNIREFWTRSSFFLVAQAALLSGFAVTATRGQGLDSAVGIALGVLGAAITVCWLGVDALSVCWIDRWRDRIVAVERVVDRDLSYDTAENVRTNCRAFRRAQDIARLVPLLFLLAWITLTVLACLSA